MNTLPIPSLAYIAGFFDGEGTIAPAFTKRCAYAQTSLVQLRRNAEVLYYCQSRWGGKIWEDPKRPQTRWYIAGPRMAVFLRDVGPWLRQKRLQAVLARTMQAMIHGRGISHPVPEGELWLRQRLARAISNLNHGRSWDWERGPRDDETFVRP